MDRIFVAAGTSVVVHLNGPVKMDMVEDGIGGRKRPFIVDDEPAPLTRVVVDAGDRWSKRIYNTVSGAAGVPVDAVLRIMPKGTDYISWEGQIGQAQTLQMAVGAGGDCTCTQADFVVPPDAEGMRITLNDVVGAGGSVGFASGIHTTFDTTQEVYVAGMVNGNAVIPLYSNLFTIQFYTMLYDGSGRCAANSTLTIVVTFTQNPPYEEHVDSHFLTMTDTTAIAQATTYLFAVGVEELNRFARVAYTFYYRYEDDANTAGGNVLFYPDTTAGNGAQPWMTWAFPLGTDVGADRRGVVSANAVHPDGITYYAIQNADLAKDIVLWTLEARGKTQ